MTDAHLRNAVAGIRGLASAGYAPAAIGSSRRSAGLWSRHVSARMTAPDVIRAAEPFVRAVLDAAGRLGPCVIYPSREESVDALVAARSRLPEGVRLPYQDAGALALVRDKRRVAELARDAGLAAPATVVEATAGELGAGAALRLPCVVKPALPGGGLPTARIVEDPPALARLLLRLDADEPLVVQERVDGGLAAVAVVTTPEGALAARFQQRTRRTWPASAGTSAVAESVAPDEGLVARVVRMLETAGYRGLAQVQFAPTERGPAILDVNPRFYGSLPLALAAGVNLPAVWHAALTGGPVTRPETYRTGLIYRWLEADLMAAARGAVGLLRPVVPHPSAGAMWDGRDPAPSALLTGAAIAARFTKLLGSMSR